MNRQNNKSAEPIATIPKKDIFLVLPFLGSQGEVLAGRVKSCVSMACENSRPSSLTAEWCFASRTFNHVRVNFVILHKFSFSVFVNRNQTFFVPSLHTGLHTTRSLCQAANVLHSHICASNFRRTEYFRTSSSHWERSAAVKGVFEYTYDNEKFNKNITYFICKMTWLHVCSLSITLTSNYWCG